MIPGTRLGPYQVDGPIGAGGMGEVWRATDTRLGRAVAIKLLPDAFASDPGRLARFEREAKLLASLSHPNIAGLYALEEASVDGAGAPVRFLAMELVEGEDLAQRLTRGPLPVADAIDVARQVAEALEEAHDKGIVHRDLKPANVKLTPEGKVKVLDFGLAKAWTDDAAVGSAPDLSQSPTLAHTGTAAGVILGTAPYMSPEQARGRPVDRRSDVWSFGVVLFEMLTARRLFEGETVSDTLAAVLKTAARLDAAAARNARLGLATAGALPGARPPAAPPGDRRGEDRADGRPRRATRASPRRPRAPTADWCFPGSSRPAPWPWRRTSRLESRPRRRRRACCSSTSSSPTISSSARCWATRSRSRPTARGSRSWGCRARSPRSTCARSTSRGRRCCPTRCARSSRSFRPTAVRSASSQGTSCGACRSRAGRRT